MKFELNNLSDYLREKRIASGLSQLDVAKRLGYSSPQFVSNWERGVVSPPLETIAVLLDLYKIPKNEIIERILSDTKNYLESNLKKKKKGKGRRS